MVSKKTLLLKKKLLILYLIQRRRAKRQNKRVWVHQIYLERKKHGAFHALIPTLRENQPEEFRNYLRVTPAEFDLIGKLIHPFLVKKRSNFRSPIQPVEMLAVTLRYLASGNSMKSLSFEFRIGYSTISCIIKLTCIALWKALQPFYLAAPNCQEDWKRIALDFFTRWNYPNCVGAIDGKHIRIQAPKNSGSLYFNYKEFHSIVLLAICDAHYRFSFIDVGEYGRHGDSTIFKRSKFGKDLYSNSLRLPPPSILPKSQVLSPYVFVGDEAFALTVNMMRPFARSSKLNENQKIFNYRLCRARRLIENSFGILCARWRIFHKPIEANISTIDWIVKSACVLHNFILTSRFDYTVDTEDENGTVIPGSWRAEIEETALFSSIIGGHNNNYSATAAKVRDNFAQYFASQVGRKQTPWQLAHVNRGCF